MGQQNLTDLSKTKQTVFQFQNTEAEQSGITASKMRFVADNQTCHFHNTKKYLLIVRLFCCSLSVFVNCAVLQTAPYDKDNMETAFDTGKLLAFWLPLSELSAITLCFLYWFYHLPIKKKSTKTIEVLYESIIYMPLWLTKQNVWI